MLTLQIDKPMPVPPYSLEVLLSAWRKGWKRRYCRSSGIPIPAVSCKTSSFITIAKKLQNSKTDQKFQVLHSFKRSQANHNFVISKGKTLLATIWYFWQRHTSILNRNGHHDIWWVLQIHHLIGLPAPPLFYRLLSSKLHAQGRWAITITPKYPIFPLLPLFYLWLFSWLKSSFKNTWLIIRTSSQIAPRESSFPLDLDWHYLHQQCIWIIWSWERASYSLCWKRKTLILRSNNSNTYKDTSLLCELQTLKTLSKPFACSKELVSYACVAPSGVHFQ